MFDKLLIHPKTLGRLEVFIANTPNTIMLTGPKGFGKATLASHLAAALLELDVEKLADYPYFHSLDLLKDKKEISIEQIREVIKLLSLQVPGKNEIRRVIVINNAGLMTTEAQNALLKTLEEPPKGTVYILTSERKNKVLPTIASRASVLELLPVSLIQTEEYFNGFSSIEVNRAWVLAQGAPALIQSLLNDEQDELKESIEQAKKFLLQKPYERLLELDALSKDKRELQNLIEGLMRVVRALYRSSAQKKDAKLTKKFSVALRELSQASDRIEANAAPRLEAIALTLNLNI